ncbi:hypothetical protein QuyetLC_24530 [Bacillus anthracis]|uniref:WxL domain-containing protein n=1 Tax=Bacillus anthracis TaxID=1392 RepID=A0A640MHM9_BACAN|nr:hypothetical protein QuyetLC_24530 [Bacillus anthracis]
MKKRITALLAVLLIISQVPFYAVQAAEVATSSEAQPALTDSTEPVGEPLLPSVNSSEQVPTSSSEVATENSATSSTSATSSDNESAQPVVRAKRATEPAANEPIEQEATDPNLAVTNKLSVVETNTVVGNSQRFSQQIIVNGTTGTSWEDVHLTTKVKLPYKGWLNTDNFVLSDIQSIDGVTHSWHWEDETTLVIEYVAPKIYVGANITIPYVLTTGSTAAENKKATVQSYITLGNSNEIEFESNQIELGAKINPWQIENFDLNMEVTEGDAELSTSYHRIYLNVPDTSIENGKVVGQKFNMKQILLNSIALPALGYWRSFDPIYLGQVTFEIQIPEGINPVNPDSEYYNPLTRTLSFTRQLDLSNLKSLNLDLLEFEEDINGLPLGNYKIPFKVTAYNDLDEATYTLLDSNFELYVKEITTSEVVAHSANNSISYDTYYVRNNELAFGGGTANLTNVELTNDWNWVLSVANQDNSDNYVDNYIGSFSWAMKSYEGTVNIYASSDGVNKEETVAENLQYKSSSYLYVKGQYKYIIIEPNADFKQHASLTAVGNFVRMYPKKTTTDPVYTDGVTQTMQTQITSKFNLRGKEYAQTAKANFLKPNNRVDLYVNASSDANQGTATQNNVTQDQTFTDRMYFNESYVDYYGENSKIIVLIPSGVTLENISYSLADAIDKNYQTVNNYQNTGKTALIFTHTPGTSSSGTSPKMYFQFKASRYTDIGNLAIEYYYSFPDIYEDYANGDLYKPIDTDTQDLNNNGSTTDKISKVTTTRTFNKTAEVLGVAEAKDASESEYTDTLITSAIYADSGIIDYTIQLRNYLDIALNGAEGVIRIPKVGANKLDASGTQLDTTKDTYLESLTIPAGFKVEYTTDDLANMTTNNIGSYSWKPYNEDIDKKIITGIHFYNNSSYSLPSQQRQRFTYSVRIDNPKIGDKIDNQSIYMYRYGSGSSGGIFTTDVKSAEVISAKQTGTFKIQTAKSKKNLSGTIQLLDEHKQVIRTIDISDAAAGTKITDLAPGKYTVHQTGFVGNYLGFDQEVEIPESEKNNNHDITIINYPAVKSIELQDVIVYVGDEWNAAMNIKQILDMNNQPLTDGEYLLSSDSKVDTTKVGTYNVELSINQGEKLTAKVHVVYGLVVNPTDKSQLLVDNPTATGTVTNTEMTLLKINYISDLEFEDSTYRPNEGLTLKAAQDTSLGVIVNGEWQQKIMNPMINVEDRRTNQAGYKLTASMSSGFISQYGRELDGAQLVFNQGASTYGTDTTTVPKLILGAGDNKELLSSNEKGSNSLSFNDVELVLPKGKSYTAGTYTAVVNWNLADGPV